MGMTCSKHGEEESVQEFGERVTTKVTNTRPKPRWDGCNKIDLRGK